MYNEISLHAMEEPIDIHVEFTCISLLRYFARTPIYTRYTNYGYIKKKIPLIPKGTKSGLRNNIGYYRDKKNNGNWN